nr:CASP-like protein 4A2 [Oryza sativa Japonica Group]
MERFYALVANVQALRAMFKEAAVPSCRDVDVCGGGGREQCQKRPRAAPWRPAFERRTKAKLPRGNKSPSPSSQTGLGSRRRCLPRCAPLLLRAAARLAQVLPRSAWARRKPLLRARVRRGRRTGWRRRPRRGRALPPRRRTQAAVVCARCHRTQAATHRVRAEVAAVAPRPPPAEPSAVAPRPPPAEAAAVAPRPPPPEPSAAVVPRALPAESAPKPPPAVGHSAA